MSTKADAQTYIHEKIHALARTLTDEQLKEWDSLETGVDLKTAEGQEVFVDLMLEHLRRKEKTGIKSFDDIIEIIKYYIEELRRKLKDANVLTPEVKDYLDSLLSDPDSKVAPEWNNYFKGEGGLFAGDEVSADNVGVENIPTKEELAELQNRLTEWLSPDNLQKAKGMDREDIFKEFGNELEPIAAIPPEYLKYLDPEIKDTRVYSGKGYFIDHAVNSHPEVKPEEYVKIQKIIDNPDDVKYDDRKSERISLIFIKKYNEYFQVIVSTGGNGQIRLVIHKTYHYKRTLPHKNLKSLNAVLPLVGGLTTISHSRNPEPGGHLSALNGTSAINNTPSLSTGYAEKSSGDNLGDLDTTLYELEQDELETDARQAIDQGMSKEDFIQKMLAQDAVEYGLEDGTFDTSLKIAGITEAEKIAELERAWQTANETAAKIDKELLPDNIKTPIEEENADFTPDEYEGNTDFNPDEYEAQLASAYDKAAEPPPTDEAITTTQADERFIDLMENEGERDKFIDLMQFTQQEEEYADFETQVKNRELADKVKRTYGALHIGAEHGVTNLSNSQKKGIHTFIKNHPTQMQTHKLTYTKKYTLLQGH
ncbi:hypothetical protein FACS1894102_5040 [Spirochaetia bacterium]|nr:hypothetical protein FACS1894102_5040 [Spirochaetia bacterium]